MTTEFPPTKVIDIVNEVSSLLKERKETISVAETAAGGIISASLLSTPGASGFYKGGLTDNIKTYSGPTPDIVAGLASNVRSKLGSTYTVAESGTAGPTGGSTPNRTPGYVALAVATESGTYKRELSTGLGGDRQANMVAFAVEALTLLRDVIKGEAKL
ncbi:hypothetical protein DH86_00002195 [Scytalidium sp. 3C]|nr:hypothetical protein DH86_00002195 [Scytalidium sp. 3C]